MFLAMRRISFSHNGSAFAAGSYTVQITSTFNMFNQSVEVLQKAGVELDSQGRSEVHTNPKALPNTSDFKPYDPAFPRAGRLSVPKNRSS